MSPLDYWIEAVEGAFEEAGIEATAEQIKSVAECVQGGHESIDLAFPHPTGPSPERRELEAVKKQLADERDKITCRECNGTGSITSYGPSHCAISQCWKCRGEGRHAP